MQQEFLQHIINGISLGSIYALIALGYTMVYGILKLINFAHADVYMVGAFAAYYTAKYLGIESSPGLPTLLILLGASILACALLGLLIERLAYRPLQHAPRLNLLITAIGVSLLLEYSAQVIFGPNPKVFPNVINDAVVLDLGAAKVRSFDVIILVIGLISMGVLHFIIHHTRAGRAMRAVSTSPTVASLMGVNTNRIVAFTFVLGSALAGVGSVLVGMKYPKIDPLMGLLIGLKAFVAAVLGGIGSVPGAVLGGVIMGLSEEMVVAYLSSTYRDAFAFGVLIVILIFKPTGLLGKNQTEKV
ncbi:MAG: branched-chain amino acid ABC transporter permease [Bdellovibrionaceae bacterium]|nr:branched-chain amino acid ABC transporter permease [Pseudobdellovibrionaceae bacterium]